MKRWIALVLTLVVLFIIFKVINVNDFIQALSNPDWGYLSYALLLFIPLFVITALRWQLLVSKSCYCSFWESIKLQLASNSLNLILPSKMGDLSKAVFLRNTGKVDLSRGFNIVIFEKLLDFSSLGAVFLSALLFHRLIVWEDLQETELFQSIVLQADILCGILIGCIILFTAFIYFVPFHRLSIYSKSVKWLEGRKYLSRLGYFLEDGQKLLSAIRRSNMQIVVIVFLSLLLWFLHMTQVYLFFRAVHVIIPLQAAYHWAPLAILIGLLPVTISGIGVRDGAFIFLFRSFGSESSLFAGSVLVTLRYVIPGLLGLLFLNEYMIREKLEIPKRN